MLEFKTANATAGAPSSAYKTVPGSSSSALSSGLDRLFSPASTGTHSRANSTPSAPRQRQELEEFTARERCKARGLAGVHRELEEYLEDPLETFSRTVRVNGVEQRAVFDPLTYWQVRAVSSISHQRLKLYHRMRKRDFQTSSVLRWMCYLRKRVLCHASGSSRLGRRPAPLAATESDQNSWKPSRL